MSRIHLLILPIIAVLALLACTGASGPTAPADRSASVAPVASAGPVASAAPVASAPSVAPAPSVAALEAELARIAPASGGTVGVAAIHIETGETASYNGALRFPMQSVYKFPIAAQLLKRVDDGKVTLEEKVRVRREDLRWGHSPVAERHPNGGEIPVRELMRLMVAESDNTASDLLMPLAGGPAAVTQLAASHGLDGIQVSRLEGQLHLDFHGIPDAPGRMQRRTLESLVKAVTPKARNEALQRYLADPRDTATPLDMARLLALLQRGELLKPASTALLLQLMTDTQTGPNRLRAGLPAGTPLAHKTGTSSSHEGMTAVVNDVGIITLPGARGHVAIAVFVKEAKNGTPAAEAAIAQAARTAHEHWTR